MPSQYTTFSRLSSQLMITALSSRLPLLISALSSVVIAVLSSWVTLHHVAKLQQQQQGEFGQSLVNIVAAQVVEPLVNQDWVSLQATLGELASGPRVLEATIHDVENELLVQGGQVEAPFDRRQLLSYSAPITFHDSMAGLITVTLKPAPQITSGLWWWIAALSVACAVLLAGYWQRQQRAMSSHTGPISHSHKQEITTVINATDAPEPNQQHVVLLEFDLLNLHTLHQQLSQSSWQALLQDLEHRSRQVCAMYGCRQLELHHHRLTLMAEGDAWLDTTFRGICASLLLLKLTADTNRTALQMSAHVKPLAPRTGSLVEQFQQPITHLNAHSSGTTKSRNGQCTVHSTAIAPELLTRVILSSDGSQSISDITPPYRDLLMRQLQQLKNS